MTEPAPWTVLRLINWTKDYLERAKLEEPRLSAEMLLAKVLGCPRVALYTQFDRVVAPDQLAQYKLLIQQASAGQPIAYLTGLREFYSLSFEVTPDVLIPRPETELLVDQALAACKLAQRAMKMWDACTGSGCVAVTAARYAPNLTALATDISTAALAVASRNAQRHAVNGRVTLAQADLLNLPPERAGMAPFDILTANPPYVSDAEVARLPPSVRCEPDLALRAGPTGLEHIRRIIQQAPPALAPLGLIAMEFGFAQAEGVYELFHASGQYEQLQVLKDHAGIERVIVARKKG
jgi:release factor glutamine methyltransferase